MRTFIITPLTKDQVKELCFVIHNGKTEEERNHAKWELAYSYEKPLYFKCRKYFKLFHKNIDEDELYDIVHDCIYVMFKKAENKQMN